MSMNHPMQPPTPFNETSEGGHVSPSQRHSPSSAGTICRPDPFTGRYDNLPSTLREKRQVEGVYAHHMDNGKATRSEKIFHPPPLQLSEKYEREMRPVRKRWGLQRSNSTTTTRRGSSTRHTGLPPVLSPPPRRMPTALGVVTTPRTASPREASQAQVVQVDGDASRSDRRANISPVEIPPEVIAAVKKAAYDWHGESGIIDDEAARLTWLSLTKDERKIVVQHYNQVQTGSTAPVAHAGTSAQHSQVLNQLLVEVDQIDQSLMQSNPRVNASPPPFPPEPADAYLNAASQHHAGALGISQSAPPTQDSAGVSASMHAQAPAYAPQHHMDTSGISQGAPPSTQSFAGASASMHAQAPAYDPQHHMDTSGISQGAPSTQSFAGVSGSVHAPAYIPEHSQNMLNVSQGPQLTQNFTGVSASMDASALRHYPDASRNGHVPGSTYISASQHHMDAYIPQGATPTQGFTGASRSTHASVIDGRAQSVSMRAPLYDSQHYPGASIVGHQLQPTPGFSGAAGPTHAPAPQRDFEVLGNGDTSGSTQVFASASAYPHVPAGIPQHPQNVLNVSWSPQPTQNFVGVSASMHTPAPRHYPNASSPGGMFGPMYAHTSRHRMDVSAIQQGVQPTQGFVGELASMAVPVHAPQRLLGTSIVPQRALPTQDLAGAAGSMHAPASPHRADASGTPRDGCPTQGLVGVSHSLHAPAPQQRVNMSHLIADTEEPLRPMEYETTTPRFSSTRGSLEHRPDSSLPFPNGVDVELFVDKGKARATDVDMDASTEDEPMHEQPSPTPQVDAHERPPRSLSAEGGLQGDVSGQMNVNATLLFVQHMRSLTSAVEDQTQEFRAFREQLAPLVNVQAQQTPGPSSSPANTGGPKGNRREQKLQDVSLRMRMREQRIELKVTRLRGVSAHNVDSGEGEFTELTNEELTKHLTLLRARMRRTFEELLQITDWADVYYVCPALTKDELALYKARDPSIVPTAKNFRIDFDLGWAKPFNKEAREVFIDRYLERVANGAYGKNPTPPQLLTRDRIGEILDKQMPNYRQKWRRSKTPLSEEKAAELARAACRRSRRRTLHESREALLVRRSLTRHVRFFKLLEPVNMSGDETDGDEKTHPPKWRIRMARWQSAELKNFLWEIDRMYRDDWRHPAHKRATGGNPPRDRVHRADCYEDGVAPVGLWRNCYDKTWLEAQAPHVVRELEIDDEDYDFTF